MAFLLLSCCLLVCCGESALWESLCLPGAWTGKRPCACPHEATGGAHGSHTKNWNAPNFRKLRQGVTWPSIVGIVFIDIIEFMGIPMCGEEAGCGNFSGKNHSGVRIFRPWWSHRWLAISRHETHQSPWGFISGLSPPAFSSLETWGEVSCGWAESCVPFPCIPTASLELLLTEFQSRSTSPLKTGIALCTFLALSPAICLGVTARVKANSPQPDRLIHFKQGEPGRPINHWKTKEFNIFEKSY